MKRYLHVTLLFLIVHAPRLFAWEFDAHMLSALEILHNSGSKSSELLGNREILVLHGFRKIEPDGSGIVLIGGQSQGEEGIPYNLISSRNPAGELDVSIESPTSFPELAIEDWFDEKTLFAMQFLHNAGPIIRTQLGAEALSFSSGSRDFIANDTAKLILRGITKNDAKHFVLSITGKFSGEDLRVSITYTAREH